MRAYCPHSPMIAPAGWKGWRLTFAVMDQLGWEGAVTTIVESPATGSSSRCMTSTS